MYICYILRIDKILNWTCITEKANAKLSEMHLREDFMKNTIEQQKEKFSQLQKDCANIKENLMDVENGITQCRSQINVISESYMKTQKEHIVIKKKIEQRKVEYDTIFKECKVC